MKLLMRGLVVLVGLLGIAAVAVSLNLARIVKKVVESEGTASLRLTTTLERARVAVFGGKLDLHELQIASPRGFSAPQMLELGNVGVEVGYSELRHQPIHVRSLTLDKPKLVLEQAGGTLNFKKAMALQPVSDSSKPPMKLVIDELKIVDAHVIVRPGLPGVPAEIDVPVPTLTMKDVGSGGGGQNGAAIKDVTMQVITALAGRAAESGALPPQLKALLHLDVAEVAGKLGLEASKRIAGAIPGELGKKLGAPAALTKDPAKLLQGLTSPAGRSAPTHP